MTSVVLFVLVSLCMSIISRSQDIQVMNKRQTLLGENSLTEVNKQETIDSHNKARSTVSPTASNMLRMDWDEGLGKLAQDYSKKCLYVHSESADRTTERFPGYNGENLYIARGTSQPAAEILIKATKRWDAEREDYIYSTSSCTRGKLCGHYTQMVWANTYAVGCGVSFCSKVVIEDGNVYDTATFVVCNYGPGGNVGGKPYIQGRPCDDCPTNYTTCINHLCSAATILSIPLFHLWITLIFYYIWTTDLIL